MAQNPKIGDTVRVVNESWADDIGRYRAVIRTIFQSGKGAFVTHFARISWKGRNADVCEQEFGTRFELGNLRKV